MEVTLVSLWLPIIVSALVVFFASALMWMVLPHHRHDWGKLPNEDEAMQVLRAQEIAPGQYSFPHCLPGQMNKPEMQEKLRQGPMGLLIVSKPGPPAMGKSLTLSFLHNLVISILVAYIAGIVLAAGTSCLTVFRVTSVAGMLGYAGAMAGSAIWFGRTWRSVLKEIFDGIVYALLTASVFAWLWP